MKSFVCLCGICLLAVASTCLELFAAAVGKQYDFPIYKNMPAGRQLTGQHAPATTPAVAAEEAQKKFTLPAGFEIRLFAAEPEVVNPVAMTWDERGRLWVIELYEYPLGAKPGEKPRDRIKILEDTDADGRADKVTVFADGLNLATGLLLGNGGVYVGQAPDLLFLRDTNSDDKADTRETLLTGFGREDRHELLNSFTWGPDGWLYFTHGVFTFSKVADPGKPGQAPVLMTAAVARFQPHTKQFEVFAEGTSNPWGVDFDRAGNAFVSACVIDHLFHMAPGGIYARQAGNPPFPYAYELLPSIVDHKHHMAAYSGVQVYQGDQYPEEYRGTVLMGNIHDNAVHQDRLTPNGSSFKASFVKDFVRANDGWFMPVSTQVGPDGCVWIMDWYDKYPCYQNANADPNGVDREHGRIWRVVYTGGRKGAAVPSRPQVQMDLARLGSAELVQILSHPNVWQRRMAQRVLNDRKDSSIKQTLVQKARSAETIEGRLAAFWTLYSTGLLDDTTLEALSNDAHPEIRTWVARFTGERRDPSVGALDRLKKLARDKNPSVRVAVATAARQFSSGSLTVDTPVSEQLAEADLGDVFEGLVETSRDGADPLLPYMIWMAGEPHFSKGMNDEALEWFRDHGLENLPLSAQLLRKTMRRLCDFGDPKQLDRGIGLLSSFGPGGGALLTAALDGLIEGQRAKALLPSTSTEALIDRLCRHPDEKVVLRALQLGTLWGNAAALGQTLALIANPLKPTEQRVEAIRSVKQQKTDPVREALLKIVSEQQAEPILDEAVRALGEIGGDTVGEQILRLWKRVSPASRRVVAEVLASRRGWAILFVTAVGNGEISASEVPVPVRRTLTQSRDDTLRRRAAEALGRYRETSADKLKLIAEKRKVVLNGPVDLNAGHEIARRTCLTCHKMHGEGADVGPDLTGVGRSTLDALLANVIDPNQVIGKGYENVEVETRDGRTLGGRLVENTDTRLKLLSAGPKEEVIAKSDIIATRVSELSVMPEGLEQMPDADFRNLIWYILNPPQDKRPLTPEVRRQLIGNETPSARATRPQDGESIALWNPEWKVVSARSDGTPQKLPEFAGRRNVLVTRPFNEETAAALERVVEIPSASKASLSFAVTAHEQGHWKLQVRAEGELLFSRAVDIEGDRWKDVTIDLSRAAGKKITLRLENWANGSSQDLAYWSDVRLIIDNARSVSVRGL